MILLGSAPGALVTTPLDLGHAVEIKGTDTTMIELRSEGRYSKLASGHGAGQTRNILFITGREKTANWLFKDHKHLILASEQVPKVHMFPDHPTRALYVHYIAADTNGDGELAQGDNATLGITKPDGSGLVQALHGVGRIISHEMANDDQLSSVLPARHDAAARQVFPRALPARLGSGNLECRP